MDKPDLPLVSVLMTAYNRENYIAEAIESVLTSTYSNFELIIVDDCSSDSTVAIANGFAAMDRRVNVYVNEKNLGDYLNRNKAASYAKGKYLKYLDSDDLIFPWGLDVMVTCMEAYPEAAMGVSQDYNIVYPCIVEPFKIYRLYYYRNLLLNIGPTATMMRRDLFERYGGFSGKNYVGDTELWLRLSQKNPLVLIPSGQVYWREHADQQITAERKNHSVEAMRQQLNEIFLKDKDCPLSPEEGGIIIRNLRNIKCRRIIQNMMKGRISLALERRKCLQLTLRDFMLATSKNIVPDQSLLNP